MRVSKKKKLIYFESWIFVKPVSFLELTTSKNDGIANVEYPDYTFRILFKL